MNRIIVVLGMAGGFASQIIFIASGILAALSHNQLLITYPYSEWIIEIPLALISTIFMVAIFWHLIKED